MNRTLLAHLAIALGLCVAAIVLVVGMEITLGTARHKEVDLEKEIVSKQTEIAQLSAARETLPVLESSEQALNTYSVNPDDIVSFLSQLEKMAKAQGANLEVLSVNDSPGAPQRLALSLHISGTFDAVVRTLGVVEYSPYDVMITSVTLDTVAAKENKVPVWSANAMVSVSTTPAKH